MNPLIDEIYLSRALLTADGKKIALHSEISRDEGLLINNLIREHDFVRSTLEVGCAYGLSSLFICDALSERDTVFHTIIDPFQTTQWQGIGINNLERAGFRFFELIEDKSEFALPMLLKYRKEKFDMILLDGWHTFDHSLVDAFFATRLLRVGGFLVFDDADWNSVGRTLRWYQGYPCYERAAATETGSMVALRKVGEDDRNWNWDSHGFR